MTKTSQKTYGQLEHALLSFGFSFSGIKEKNKVFEHEATGALVIYPEFPCNDPLLPRHEHMVETILDVYGIAEPGDFARELQTAS